MRRRDFVLGAASLAGATQVWAQTSANSPRLAIVDVTNASAARINEDHRYYRIFFGELRRLGRIEGKNLIVERYSKEELVSDAVALAAEVVRSNPDVIYIIAPSASNFKRETTTIPIVTITYDPVATGFAQSMARPGGNITGVSVDTGPSIHGKRIELLREIFPAMSKLACISPKGAWEGLVGAPVRAAAEAAGISVANYPVQTPGSAVTYRDAVKRASHDGANAIMVVDSPDALANRTAIAEALADVRIPAIHAFTETVEAGGLIAYAFDLRELVKRMAGDVDAILRGANPAEIPFYQVSKFDLSINLMAARALGLTVPTALLATAEKVVE